MAVAKPRLDTDGYDEKIRRRIISQVLANVRAKGVEPHQDVLAIYDEYITGLLSRLDFEHLLRGSLHDLRSYLGHYRRPARPSIYTSPALWGGVAGSGSCVAASVSATTSSMDNAPATNSANSWRS